MHHPTAAEKEADGISRREGDAVSPRKLLGVLESRGWQKEAGGSVDRFERRLSEEVSVALPLRPGFEVAYLADAEDVTLGAVEITRGGQPGGVADLDAVAFSEVVGDLMALG